MFILSGLTSFSLLKIYDKKEIDWVRIEAFKESQGTSSDFDEEHNLITKRIEFLKKKSSLLLAAFFVGYDPTFTTIYFRKGHHKWNRFSSPRIFGLYLFSLTISSTIMYNYILVWIKFISFILQKPT